MKKLIITLGIIVLICVLILGGLLWYLLSMVPEKQQGEVSDASVEEYIESKWTVFRLKKWDGETKNLELEYDLPFTYEQVTKYADDVEELKQTPEGNLLTAADLCTTVREELGVEIRSVKIRGVTSDGQTAYTVGTDGTYEVCWPETETETEP